jgi:hypothetical protein
MYDFTLGSVQNLEEDKQLTVLHPLCPTLHISAVGGFSLEQ